MKRKPVVAIVDDDQSVRDGLSDLVNSMGFDSETFERPEHFLQCDNLNRTSCLITDVRMPGMTGLELHDRLVAAGKRIPTIMITAFPKEGDQQRAARAGIVCYLRKPFDERQLLDCITSALDPDYGR